MHGCKVLTNFLDIFFYFCDDNAKRNVKVVAYNIYKETTQQVIPIRLVSLAYNTQAYSIKILKDYSLQ